LSYDDGGFSGGSTDRPALQRLLDDVRGGKIDVIVVYKVDRLTRSLADFAKLVELFDAHSVSFVSVTQQFNTTTSMGRLTLNVLLSFAQFEREVTAERIRDKIAASKRKGLWVGGMVPLGYDTKDRKITINEEEAERVRTIFRRYLELGSLGRLLVDLRQRGIVTKQRTQKTGKTIGGIPFTRGPLAHLLRNRFYIGEVVFKGEILPGEQPAIVDRDLYEAVQAKLDEQTNNHKASWTKSEALLIGRIFDDRGNRMTPSHSQSRGVRHRYYVSAALFHGQPEKAGSVRRVPATTIEALIVRAIQENIHHTDSIDHRELITTHVDRIEVCDDHLRIKLNQGNDLTQHQTSSDEIIELPWQRRSLSRRREILKPANATSNKQKSMRAENRELLIESIARGRRWLHELITDPTANTELIAERESCSIRKVNMTLSLAFLAPGLVRAAIEGRLPHGMGVARLCDLPPEWSRQYPVLGLATSQSPIRTASLAKTS